MASHRYKLACLAKRYTNSFKPRVWLGPGAPLSNETSRSDGLLHSHHHGSGYSDARVRVTEYASSAVCHQTITKWRPYCNAIHLAGSTRHGPWLFQTAPFSQQSNASLNKSLGQAGDGDKTQDRGEETVGLQKSWIYRYLPGRMRPFALLARLDKPIGTWLLAWPCMWSIALAAPAGNLPDFKTLALFGAGAVLLRGAGCTVNDLLDQDIDRKVERTKLRPIACGAVTPFQGLTFLGLQLLLGLGILLQLNRFSQILGASSLLLVGTYPLFKRWTYWPQAFLGLTLNWGALLGWAAVKGSIDMPVIAPLYLAGICWTLVYDTIYAHQDKYDDVKVGVKSTALYFGDQTKLWLGGFGIMTVSSLFLAGHNDGLGWLFYSSLLGAATHLYWQISTVDLQNCADCNSKFVSNKWFGAIVFAGIASEKLFG